jgi:AcrR family transcriptional regulator
VKDLLGPPGVAGTTAMAGEMVRQGGRSARLQREVYATVRALRQTGGRGALTVPMIAERAGVRPSRIYPRWDDLGQLFANVALERLRPIADPGDTGPTSMPTSYRQIGAARRAAGGGCRRRSQVLPVHP